MKDCQCRHRSTCLTYWMQIIFRSIANVRKKSTNRRRNTLSFTVINPFIRWYVYLKLTFIIIFILNSLAGRLTKAWKPNQLRPVSMVQNRFWQTLDFSSGICIFSTYKMMHNHNNLLLFCHVFSRGQQICCCHPQSLYASVDILYTECWIAIWASCVNVFDGDHKLYLERVSLALLLFAFKCDV